ncbi:hypothetical protein ABEB36_005023 [Hypothenemus hampei]|uniref:Uncharacterized protein n=1 Tax=Hypothenemus hampei TaxID=57062 RepID=A0ABD1EWN2_HYPHA
MYADSLDRLKCKNKIILVWVPGLSDIYGNEVTDSQGATASVFLVEKCISLPETQEKSEFSLITSRSHVTTFQSRAPFYSRPDEDPLMTPPLGNWDGGRRKRGQLRWGTVNVVSTNFAENFPWLLSSVTFHKRYFQRRETELSSRTECRVPFIRSHSSQIGLIQTDPGGGNRKSSARVRQKEAPKGSETEL